MAGAERNVSNRGVPEGAYEPRGVASRVARAALVVASVVVIGTAGYMILEGWNLLDALYMTVITISGTGFEEVRDLSRDTIGRIWTITLILGGAVAFVYAASLLVELAVEGAVRGYFRKRRMRAEIDKLNDHYVLCGYGR